MQTNGTGLGIIDPVVLAKPNLALWVTRDHKFVQNSEAECGAH